MARVCINFTSCFYKLMDPFFDDVSAVEIRSTSPTSDDNPEDKKATRHARQRCRLVVC
jgi:hypothetical protein